MNTLNTQKVGQLGEGIACMFLVKQGLKIVERNYWKKWGEIDIVAEKGSKLYFIEVKTVARENNYSSVSRETEGEYRPEENVHPKKLARMRRVIQTYLIEKKKEEGDWQFDVLTVVLNLKDKTAKCNLIEDIIL